MASLIITTNNAANPQTLDLTKFMNVQRDAGMDPADPAFTEKVWARSLLKEGATLALESFHEKELLFPLELNSVSLTGVLAQIQQINQIVTTPGATCSWQPDGASQATTFDILSGQVDVEYDFRREGQKWTSVKLRIFTQPLGRAASPRVYATASGVGPLLMISPYASGGALVTGASTQAGVAGFGAGTPSSGIFYWGAPSLAGDAQAQLQISYVGPRPTGASQQGLVPYAFVSLLPDRFYTPLIPANAFITAGGNLGGAVFGSSQVIASQYLGLNGIGIGFARFQAPWGASAGIEPTLAWAGNHRLLAIARASRAPAYAYLSPGPNTPVGQPTTTILPGGDWQVYDLGVYSLRASEYPTTQVIVNLSIPSAIGATNSGVDLNALITLPDNATWALNPVTLQGSQYGRPPQVETIGGVPFTNTLLMDDVLGDQFIFSGQAQTSAPSPLGGAVASSARITQFSRGLIPRPDPKAGLPIIALVGVGQWGVPSNTATFFGASWANPTNLTTLAQVNVLERTRYILP